jgi:hypothetical protein
MAEGYCTHGSAVFVLFVSVFAASYSYVDTIRFPAAAAAVFCASTICADETTDAMY